jgi:hypothetical protein
MCLQPDKVQILGTSLVFRTAFLTQNTWHMHDDVSVFVVWHISTAGMLFDISARNLAYQLSFGISARILAYQPGIWGISPGRPSDIWHIRNNNGKRCGLIL